MVTMGKTTMPQSSVHGAGACSRCSFSAHNRQDMSVQQASISLIHSGSEHQCSFKSEVNTIFIHSDYVPLTSGEMENGQQIITQIRDMEYSLELNSSLFLTTDYGNKIYTTHTCRVHNRLVCKADRDTEGGLCLERMTVRCHVGRGSCVCVPVSAEKRR